MTEQTLYPINFGQYNWEIEAESEAAEDPETGRYYGGYNWFPEPSEITETFQNPQSLAWADVFHTIYEMYDGGSGGPPEDLVVEGSIWMTSSFYTFDISGIAPEDVENAYLEIDLAEVWLFVGNSGSGNPNITYGPDVGSSTRTIAIDYITGENADLTSFTDLAEAKMASWPYNGDVGVINLEDFLDIPDTNTNSSPGTVSFPISTFADAVDGNDWISFCFIYNTRPMHFWTQIQYEDFDDEGQPYTASYYTLYNDSSYVLLENPVTGIRVVVNQAVTKLAATDFIFGLDALIGALPINVEDEWLEEPALHFFEMNIALGLHLAFTGGSKMIESVETGGILAHRAKEDRDRRIGSSYSTE